MKTFNSKRCFVFILLLHSLCCLAQNSNSIYAVTYRVNTTGLSLSVPDTLLQQLGSAEKNIRLPLATIFYKNYYQKGLSRTDMYVEAGAGVRLKNDQQQHSVFSRTNDSAQFLFEDGKMVDSYTYRMPSLVKMDSLQTIKGYLCNGYLFNDSTLKAIVWFTRKLPAYFSPGIYYNNLGAIVRIDYSLDDTKWSVELESFEKLKAVIDFKKDLPKNTKKRKAHFLFKK